MGPISTPSIGRSANRQRGWPNWLLRSLRDDNVTSNEASGLRERSDCSDSTKSNGELRKHCVAWEEKVSELTSEIPGHTMFDMAANLHKKLFPRVVVSDGDAPRMVAIMEALEAARSYGRKAE